MSLTAKTIITRPHANQKPGTSGLRKKVKVFQAEHYTENFIQCILDSSDGAVIGSTLVVGGDGRYFCKAAAELIVRICAANGVAKLLVGQNAIISTPAVSSLIRRNKAYGGILLTASHNPGGPDNDFGIKFNCENGGPAPDHVTNKIYDLSTTISQYKIVDSLSIDVSTKGVNEYMIDGRTFTVEVIDSVADYVQLMKEIFDFERLRAFVSGEKTGSPLKLRIDSLNGVTGPYVNEIFLNCLGATPQSVVHTTPLEDFGGLHPDPNLTYAKDLVDTVKNGDYDLGAAFDGDGDRNMIIGHKAFFVTPSDSLAVSVMGLKPHMAFRVYSLAMRLLSVTNLSYHFDPMPPGFARSMPTASAVDLVAAKLGKECFEVPTGWKYFGNLMDAGRLCLCGEESFGTGSDHIREKDGIWAALAWLSVMEHTSKSIEDILKQHWTAYGRNYFTRYDYEDCDLEPCNDMIATLEKSIANPEFVGKEYTSGGKTYKVKVADNFSYTDPVDKSVSTKQGVRVVFEDGSRIVMRLSGTGSSGATVRLYIDSYEKNNVLGLASEMLEPLIQVALEISQLPKFTSRNEPTVIT